MSRAKSVSKAHAQGRKTRPAILPEKGLFLTPTNLKILGCILLAGVTIGLYSPVLAHSFLVWDDHDYITANPHVHGGLAWNTVKWAFTSTEAANWHPLTWLSHALDYQLFGMNAAGHHFDSVLLHAVNVVLLFLVLGWITGRVGPSFMVAALFAVHPINVESVAWVAERKNVLSTLFFILAVAAYAWYSCRPDWRRYLLVVGMFAAGLMAKPMVITLPFVLLLLDYWPLERMTLDNASGAASSSSSPSFSFGAPRRSLLRLVVEKIPVFVLSAASAWITMKAQRGAVRNFEEFPLAIRVQNAVVAYGLYLWKMLWPERLAFYPHTVDALPAWQWILSAIVLIGITALVIMFRSHRYLPVGWFWFMGMLIPVLGLVQVGEAAMADRYAYVPLIGIFIMIVWGVADWAQAKKVHTAWLLVPSFCALVALGFASVRQMRYWGSDYDVWAHSLEVAENPFAHNAMGTALMNPAAEMTQLDLENFDTEQKRMEEARRHFERAYELRQQQAQREPEKYQPYLAGSLNNLGTVDREQNRTDDARQHFKGALKIYRQLAQKNPDRYQYYLASTLNNLGRLDRAQNHAEDARRHYEEALPLYRKLAEQDPHTYLPDLAAMLNNLGNLDGTENRLPDARGHFEEGLRIYSSLTEDETGKTGTASGPNGAIYMAELATTLGNLEVLDGLQNRPEDARQHYQKSTIVYGQLALRDPDKYLPYVARTAYNMGTLDKSENKIEDARAEYQKALDIFQRLTLGDSRYASEVARVDASLKGLASKTLAQ